MSDKRKDGPSGMAQIVRLGDRRPPHEEAPNALSSVEALRELASELARFERSVADGSSDPASPQARVTGLAAMQSRKSPLSMKRDDAPAAATEAAPVEPFARRRPKPDPK